MNTSQLEAQSDIERKAVEDTVGEIRHRLSPGQLVDEVLAYTKDGGGEFLSNLGRQATDNPLPVTLIGAGLAWFLFSKSGTYASARPKPQGQRSYTGFPKSESPDETATNISDATRNTFSAVREGLTDVKDEFTDTLSNAQSQISSASRSVKDRIAEGAASVKETAETAKASAASVRDTAIGYLKDQPLVLLGAGLALGAAVGAGLPGTEAENRLMGEASEEVKKQVKETASDQIDQARAVGEDLYEGIKQEVRDGVSGLTNMQAH